MDFAYKNTFSSRILGYKVKNVKVKLDDKLSPTLTIYGVEDELFYYYNHHVTKAYMKDDKTLCLVGGSANHPYFASYILTIDEDLESVEKVKSIYEPLKYSRYIKVIFDDYPFEGSDISMRWIVRNIFDYEMDIENRKFILKSGEEFEITDDWIHAFDYINQLNGKFRENKKVFKKQLKLVK